MNMEQQLKHIRKETRSSIIRHVFFAITIMVIFFVMSSYIYKYALEADTSPVNYINQAIEQSYIQGYIDAIEGHKTLEKKDSCWYWVTSPYKSGKPTITTPPCDSKLR